MGRRGLSRAVKRAPTPPEAIRRCIRFWLFEDELSSAGQALPPISAQALFGREAPMELEVGSGTGEFLCALASAHPDCLYLGVDPSTQSVLFGARLAWEARLDNVLFIRGPMNALYMHLRPGVFRQAYMHFPDPYVRNRGTHKMINAPFLSALAYALAPEGRFSFVSDHEALFFEALALVEGLPEDWRRVHEERFLMGYEPPLKSRYQLKWERWQVSPRRFEVQVLPRKRTLWTASAP